MFYFLQGFQAYHSEKREEIHQQGPANSIL